MTLDLAPSMSRAQAYQAVASSRLGVLAEVRQALARSDGHEVSRLSSLLRQNHPDDVHGNIECAKALRMLNRPEECDAILRQLIDLRPLSIDAFVNYALHAVEARDWPEAIRRWEDVSVQFPELLFGPFNKALVLRNIKRFDEADILLNVVHQQFPEVFQVAYQWALNPHYFNAHPTAAVRWEKLRQIWPNEPAGYSWGSAALRESGRLDEAKTVLAKGEERFPDNTGVQMEAALLAGRLEHWPDALRRWDALQEKEPTHPHIISGRKEAHLKASYALADKALADQPQAVDPTKSATVGPPFPWRDMSLLFNPELLVTRFESLGQDCEFGLVQRHYKAEPLGLLRWGGSTIDHLIRGVQNRFAGLGDAGTLRLEDRGSEYLVHDETYKSLMHTFIEVDQQREPKILAQLSRRMVFLRRMLIDHINAADRVFIFKDRLSVGDETLLVLHDELLKCGNSALVVVQKARTDCPATEVRRIRSNLFVGYITMFGNDPCNADGSWNIQFLEWLNICRIVYSAAS